MNQTKLYTKLLQIQKQIVGLGKDKAAYGYKYVTGDKVLEHLKPLMNEYGLILKQEVLSIENARQDYQTKSGTTSEINSKVMMRFTWVDCETGEKDENLFGANGQNAWDKGVGSALTYGERYFLLKFFHIATDEDDIDNPDRKPQEAAQAPQTPQAIQYKQRAENVVEMAPVTLQEALQQIAQAKTPDEVKQIYKSMPQFQAVVTFKKSVVERGLELKGAAA
jgi:hypothetical protein